VWAVWILGSAAIAFGQQTPEDDFHVYTDAPRLLLTKNRLRLLQRERERTAMRWVQFDSLVTGGAAMPEPGFAYGLYYRVSTDRASGRRAVEWALGASATDLRQLALVFDWCAPVMQPTELNALGSKIEKALAAGPAAESPNDIKRQSARALAAIAISDRLPDHGDALLRGIVEGWWRAKVLPRLTELPLDQSYALYELFHAIRDNLKIDLRDGASSFFRAYPIEHLTSHYPAPLEAPDGEYRVPIFSGNGEPSPVDAAMSRAAEMEIVAFDTNALESQYVQGWVMQDRYLMRGALGCGYEFLWANPYQPGLSYFQVPLVYHNAASGNIFARTSWDEDASWLGFFSGRLQFFQDGRLQTLKPGAPLKPLRIGGVLLMTAPNTESTKFRADSDGVFLLGLTPKTAYDVEIDDEEMYEAVTDAGGTLVIALNKGAETGIRLKKSAPAL
jgi:hypothetical protein